MTEIVIERPDVTYEITVDDNTYVIDGRFIYTNTDFDAETLQGEGGEFYLDRTNHTGNQSVSTITGLATVATSGSYLDLTNTPTISTDATTLDGEDGLYYLSRTNHTGTQLATTVSDFSDAARASVVDNSIAPLVTNKAPSQDATFNALSLKVDKIAGKGLSTEDYTTVEKSKLAGVASGATANSTDASLRDRATHTGTQLATTISDFSATVSNVALTGLSTATNAPVLPTDLLLAGIGKLQAQATANTRRNRIPAITGRYYTNANFGVVFSASTVAAGQLRTTFFEPLTDMTVDQIGVFLTVAPTAGSKIKLAIYEFDTVNLSQLNLVHTVPEIIADATIGAKLATTSFSFKLGRVYVITHLSDQSLGMRNIPSSSTLSAGLDVVSATSPISLWLLTGVTYSATAPTTLDLSTFSTLSSNTSLILMRSV